MALISDLFSLCPRIAKEDSKLMASTPWRLRILSLGTFYRRVVVDPHKKEMLVDRRYLWIFSRRRKIKFKAIEAITYTYEDWALESLYAWAHDSLDQFAVGLKLYNGDDVHLFSFVGGGTFGNDGPAPDWMYWQEFLFDVSGNQEGASRRYVDLLGKMIAVPVIPGASHG